MGARVKRSPNGGRSGRGVALGCKRQTIPARRRRGPPGCSRTFHTRLALATPGPARASPSGRTHVALARTLLRDRPVLLLDEPFSALDDDTRAVIRTLVKSLTERHRWITLLVSHHVDDVEALASKRYHMRDGMLFEV